MRRPVHLALIVALLLPAGVALADEGPSRRIQRLMASADGASEETAYKVRSVREEYELLAALGLRMSSQSLVVGERNRAYDLIEARDVRTGETRRIWFNISSFYGRGLGF